ncbi:unnamed protein product [Caenorhabditis angaria]|uniref:ENTH domain-containing protein n=1 Tax=Caenorhabditis angaria TaxID=860376 RepID=A0A9P1NB77_9PELO|nr:unnamed protein product [Caenorhabditis angaria]
MSDLFTGITSSLKTAASAITKSDHVRKLADAMSEAIMNYSEAEKLVREATNEDPWGPTGPQMKRLCEYTKSGRLEDFYNVYTPLFGRMFENNQGAWRRVYKSLVLFDYLLKNGSERFVNESREKIYELRRLESYKHTDEKGKDQGINIRHRVKLILDMLNDEDQLREERSKANSVDKSKYRGFDQYDMKSSSSGFGSSGNSSWGKSSSSDFSKKSSDYGKDEWSNDGGNRDGNGSGNGNREVSNFSFSANKAASNRSPSPELGFVNDDNRKTQDDDDGFGDFVSSRSTQSAPTSINTAKTARSSNAFSTSPIPSAIPPPTASNILPRKPSLTNDSPSNFDLLGGLGAPSAPAAQTAPQFDLFSQIPAAPQQSTQTQKSALIDDVFGETISSPVAAPILTSPPVAQNSSIGGLNDFDFGAAFTATPAPVPMQAQTTSVTKPTSFNEPKVGNSFAGLDQFMNLSLSPSGTTPKAKTLNQMMGN